MQAVLRTTLLVGVVAACHTSDPGTPDGHDTDPDGSASLHGLSVSWSTKPTTIPGVVKTDLTVTNMLFRMTNLRVIGDAGPGDTRTSQDSFQIAWSEGQRPATIEFADAPTGLYSKVVILADGNLIDYSYEIDGTVKLLDVVHPFKIHDRSPLAIALNTDVNLTPGHGAALGIRLELQPAIDTIDFSMLAMDNGVLELDTFDNQMGNFREKMISSTFVATSGAAQ